MAIQCRNCGKDYDVTLFEFGHSIRCECGSLVKLHLRKPDKKYSNFTNQSVQSDKTLYFKKGKRIWKKRKLEK